MQSWNAIFVEDKEYQLLNSSLTSIKFSNASKFDLALLMSKMEERGVPLSYTSELTEIKFTQLRNGDHGDYLNGVIRLSSDKTTQSLMDKIFVHELAHHVDCTNNITDDDSILREKKKKSKYMKDKYARKDVFEYFAVGFEVFYCGTDEEKRFMKKKNPILFSVISKLHKEHCKK